MITQGGCEVLGVLGQWHVPGPSLPPPPAAPFSEGVGQGTRRSPERWIGELTFSVRGYAVEQPFAAAGLASRRSGEGARGGVGGRWPGEVRSSPQNKSSCSGSEASRLEVLGTFRRGCGSGRRCCGCGSPMSQNGDGSRDSCGKMATDRPIRATPPRFTCPDRIRATPPDRFDTRTGPRPVPGPAPGPVPGAKGQPAPRGAKPRGQSPRGCALEKIRAPVVYFFRRAPPPTKIQRNN